MSDKDILKELDEWLEEATRSLEYIPTHLFNDKTLAVREAKISSYQLVKSKLRKISGMAER